MNAFDLVSEERVNTLRPACRSCRQSSPLSCPLPVPFRPAAGAGRRPRKGWTKNALTLALTLTRMVGVKAGKRVGVRDKGGDKGGDKGADKGADIKGAEDSR